MQDWALHDLLHLMISPALLYLLSHLIFSPDPAVSLREHYFERHRLLFSVVALSSLVALTYRPLAFGESFFEMANLSTAAQLAGAILLAVFPSRVLHSVFVPAGALLALADLVSGLYTISSAPAP